MLKQFRHQIIQQLWESYRQTSMQIKKIELSLQQIGVHKLVLDHFAIIDLPGPHSGIPHLKQLFSAIGYIEQGKDYLPEKQNDFLWMTEVDSAHLAAQDVLPQIVVADFRLDELPIEVKKIIEKYASLVPSSPQQEVTELVEQVATGDMAAATSLNAIFRHYFGGREWPLPTVKEFHIVHEFNELLSWALLFGRKPNHFTLSIHLLNHFASLDEFLQFITEKVKLELNKEGGVIKGGKTVGIAQASTNGYSESIALQDGTVEIPAGFVEFVWRYSPKHEPILWEDYFTGFIANHADHVIESLYTTSLAESRM